MTAPEPVVEAPETRTLTRKNGAEVRDWVNELAPAGESWFVTKGMTSSSGGQVWRYVRDDAVWPARIVAAVYDVRTGDWQPLAVGDVVIRVGHGYGVIRPEPLPGQ